MAAASRTAWGLIPYDRPYFGAPLSTWVDEAQGFMYACSSPGWGPVLREPGSFEYDSIACTLSHILDEEALCRQKLLVDMAARAHAGWCVNYTYWRDLQPYLTDPCYRAPASPLGDPVRDMGACLRYGEIEASERSAYLTLAMFVVSKLDQLESTRKYTVLGSIPYDRMYHEIPISTWAEGARRAVYGRTGLTYRPMSPGTFEYDGYVFAVVHALAHADEDQDEVAHKIYKAWDLHRLYWLDRMFYDGRRLGSLFVPPEDLYTTVRDRNEELEIARYVIDKVREIQATHMLASVQIN